MFTSETVFVLGAGASWHYGYPTGEGLVKKVVQKATYLSSYLEFSAQTQSHLRPAFVIENAPPNVSVKEQWQTAFHDCEKLKTGLEQVNPLVIDYFLGWNPRLQRIGRLLIAWVILESEHLYLQMGGNINRKEALLNSPLESDRIQSKTINLKKCKDDWCRFVIHQLVIDCKTSSDILENKVCFVTFNYDVSLERALYFGLRHIQFLQPEDVQEFLGGNRIMHVYGKVREKFSDPSPNLKWSEQGRNPKGMGDNTQQHLHDYRIFLDHIYSASQGIRVIDPSDKETDRNIIDAATKAITAANRVYILGYGFDANNSRRIGLTDSLHYGRSKKSVMFTNYCGISRVNKRASNIFFGAADHFGPNDPSIETPRDGTYERSVRDVYESLELDFESLD